MLPARAFSEAFPAEAPRPPEEVVALRTSTSKTFDNHDGTFTSEIFPGPIFYQPRGRGQWRPIDLAFRPSTEPGVAAVSARSPVPITLRGRDAQEGFVTLGHGDYSISYRLPGGAAGRSNGPPALHGSRADVADLLPGVDLRLFAGTDGPKSFLILRSAPEDPSFTFVVDAPGLDLRAKRDGSAVYLDAEGTEIARIPRPYVVDSSVDEGRGGGRVADAVELKVTKVGDEPAITLAVDPAWLATATYPVYVDPSTTFTTGSDAFGDVHVVSDRPTLNYEAYKRPDSPYYYELWLGMDPTDSASVSEDFLKFDVSTLKDATIELAKLDVFPYHQYYNAPTSRTTWVNKVNGPWTESTLTWGTRPGTTSITSAGTVEGQTGYFTITSTVQGWVNNLSTNHGVKLHQNGNNGTYWKRLIASEQGGANVPHLVVTWHRPTAATTSPAPDNWTKGSTLSWSFSDTSGHAQSHYEVQVATSSAFTTIVDESGVVASSTARSWTADPAALTSGSLYFWRVRVKDGSAWSAWDTSTFIWDTLAPTGTVSINGGAASTDAATTTLSLSVNDVSTSSVYSNDGTSLTSVVPGCASMTCGAHAAPTVSLDSSEGAVRVVSDKGGTTSTWHSLTADAAATNRPALAMDIKRSSTAYTYVGLISDDNDGFRYELRTAGASNLTTYGYSNTSTPGSFLTGTINLPFDPNVWYRLLFTTSGGTVNWWWWKRGDPQPDAPLVTTSGVYLPKPRLHIFQRASTSAPATAWIDDVKVTQSAATAPFGSGVTGLRLSDDGATWGAWQGYRDKVSYTLPSAEGEVPVYVQTRDGVGNISATIKDSITFKTLARRAGLNSLWTYAEQDHGGGNRTSVNVSSGNRVLQHNGGSIDARGFTVDLVHTYNSQDGYGEGDAGGFYGEGWTFSQNLRLFERDGGAKVIYKDGSGDESRVFTKDADASGTRSYLRPVHFAYTLKKDVATPPADASKVFTLTADAGGEKAFFDAAGKLTRRQDRNDNYLDYAYDGSGRLIRITDVAGRGTILEYAGTGSPARLSKITDMAGRISTYGYDTGGNLVEIAHAVGTTDEVTTTFGYGPANELTSVTNPRGHTSTVRYRIEQDWELPASTDGWVANPASTVLQSTVRSFSGTGSLQADVDTAKATPADPAGARRTFATPVSWGSVRQTLLAWIYVPSTAPALRARIGLWNTQPTGSAPVYGPETALTTGGWTLVSLPDARVDPAAKISQLRVQVYPPAGGTNYKGSVWIDTITARGTVSEMTDAKPAANTIVRFGYDWDGRITRVSRPDQNGVFRDTSYTYSRNGQVTEVKDPLGNVTKNGYDEFLRLSTVTPPAGGGSYTYSYYPNSMHLQSWTDEAGGTSVRGVSTTTGDTRYMIDPLNDERYSSGQPYVATTYTRDADGNVLSAATNWYAGTANLEQDPFPGFQSQIRVMDFTYKSGGLLGSMKDPKGNVTYFDYDIPRGYLTKIDAPAGNGEAGRRITTIVPNADGSTSRVANPAAQTVTYGYDGLARLRTIDYGPVAGAPAMSVAYTLDANGNMTEMTDDAGLNTWTYDENNQRTEDERRQNHDWREVTYNYFPNGLMSSLTTRFPPPGPSQTTSFGYDAALRLTSQTDPNDGDRTITFGYDERSRRESVTFPSGVEQRIVYDRGRIDLLTLERSDGSKLQSFDYAYFTGGSVSTVTELDGSAVSYTYDDANRLKTAVRTGTSPFNQSYGYDANNNRTSITAGGVTTMATYDPANQLISFGSTSYDYDRRGNLTSFGANTLSYDAANHWSTGTVNGQSLAFAYDGLGRRVSQAVGGDLTDYWYDDRGLTDESGPTKASYLRDPSGLLLSVASGGSVADYVRDRLGSVTGLVSTTGTMANRYTYDPWGQTIASTGSLYNPFGYTGTYKDAATGLYMMGARYYQPGTGRFTQLDPLPKSLVTVNRYAYVACNPANYTDPSGLACSDAEVVLRVAAAAFIIGVGIGFVVAGGWLVVGAFAEAAVVTSLVGLYEAIALASWGGLIATGGGAVTLAGALVAQTILLGC